MYKKLLHVQKRMIKILIITKNAPNIYDTNNWRYFEVNC